MPPWVNTPEFVRAAQAAFEAWDFGRGWGACLAIAQAWAQLLPQDLYWVVVDLDTEPPHTVLWVTDRVRVWVLDLDWRRYETCEGGWFRRIEGAVFTEADVSVTEVHEAWRDDFILEANQEWTRRNKPRW